MLRAFLKIFLVLIVLFILPALTHLGFWSLKQQPQSWRHANWSSAQILPEADQQTEARIYILAARTGGIKGAFATHSWIVTKRAGGAEYDRYDVVGWGRPVRKNAYDADGRWYSNTPVIEAEIKGEAAEKLIPKLESAIENYNWRKRGDYTIWPGPNSNTFVASVIRSVPGLDARTPSTAVGRDYPANGKWIEIDRDQSIRVTAGGYAGFVLGRKDGLELNFLGLVAGFDPLKGLLKIPGFGSFELYPPA